MPTPIDRDTYRMLLRTLDDRVGAAAFYTWVQSMDWPMLQPRGPSSLVKDWDKMEEP